MVVRLQVSADVKPYVPASRIILLTSVFASTSGRKTSFLYFWVGKLQLFCKGTSNIILTDYILNIFIFHRINTIGSIHCRFYKCLTVSLVFFPPRFFEWESLSDCAFS